MSLCKRCGERESELFDPWCAICNQQQEQFKLLKRQTELFEEQAEQAERDRDRQREKAREAERENYRYSGSSYSGSGSGSGCLTLIGLIFVIWISFSNKPQTTPVSTTPPTPIQPPIQQARDPAFDEYMNQGYEYTKVQDYENALASFEKALAIDPNDSYALKAIQNVKGFISEKKYYEYINLGYSLLSQKDSLGAIENFSKALSVQPQGLFKASEALANVRYEQYMQIGDKLIESKDYKSALVAFEMAQKVFNPWKRNKISKAFPSIINAAKLTAIDLIKPEVTSVSNESQSKIQFGLYLDLSSQIRNEQNFEDSFLILSKALQQNPSEQKAKTAFQKTAKQLAEIYIRK
jgi:tetratricopeptide (TPR) repeat protein